MQYEELIHIAALVREDPGITVKEIAKQLRFADSKSVYYWLGKGNFRGLRHFKQEVLSDETLVDGIRVSENGRQRFLLRIPLRAWDTSKKTEDKGSREFFFLHETPNPRGLFAIVVPTNTYSPWYHQGDYLVISTIRPAEQLAWFLLKSGRTHLIGRLHNGHILEPHSLAPYPKHQYKRVGRIIAMFRMYG